MEIVNFEEKFLDDIIKIEEKSFINPWTKDMFLSSAKNSAVKFRILIKNKTVVGYYVISSVADETEILDIAVNPDFRKQSLGKSLLEDIKKEAAGKIFLEVRKSNVAALNLYKLFNFEEIAIRKRYYKNEDALILRLVKEII
ncbi:MAG: ribosomal protein S18-alanine N-acetyltransferase [Endomicrobium sp.]|nr:ribosomal protein S18-alanine N-acetyltransferase [Endomicrobium sp.]